VGRGVAGQRLGEVVEDGVGEGAAQVEALGEQRQHEQRDAPRVRGDGLGPGDAGPDPARAGQGLERERGLQGLDGRGGWRGHPAV
jgi:hypothetical protein